MRYLQQNEIYELHQAIVEQTGGIQGIRDVGALEAALGQPQITFDGHDLYPTLIEKAATLGFLLINNHPFLDGNKRVGHAALEVFLLLNGAELDASIDEQEKIILQVAAGTMSRHTFVKWVALHTVLSSL